MPSASRLDKKEAYHQKLCDFLQKYDKAFLVHADNVGSLQFQEIRRALRPNSVILMGKNTMMKRSIRLFCEQTGNDQWLCLVEQLVGNVGLVFTSGELSDLREEINKYQVGAPARVGVVAPNDVFVDAGSTGMDPSQTSFFQALGIATKINKGTIEITANVHLIKAGEKVGGSEATLLSKLGIKPFKYGLQILKVYENGSLFDTAVLDITDDDVVGAAMTAIQQVAALSLGANYPTLAAVPHVLIDAYKNVLAIAVATEYSFPLADKVKEILANPEAFMAAAAVAATPAAGGAAAPAAKAPEPEEEEEEEEMGFDLFD